MAHTPATTKLGSRGKITPGATIKTGTTGKKPVVESVIWTGTAEVITYGIDRLPAAIVATNKGEMAVVQLAGSHFENWQWWDARLFASREWEDADGELVGDTKPEIAARIDHVLATASSHHEFRGKQVSGRVASNLYGTIEPAVKG